MSPQLLHLRKTNKDRDCHMDQVLTLMWKGQQSSGKNLEPPEEKGRRRGAVEINSPERNVLNQMWLSPFEWADWFSLCSVEMGSQEISFILEE